MYNKILQKIKMEMPPIDDINYGGMSHDIQHVFESDENKVVTITMGKNNEICVVEIECKNLYDYIQDLYAEAKILWDFIKYSSFQMSSLKYYSNWVVLDGVTLLKDLYYFHCIIKIKCPNYEDLADNYEKNWGDKNNGLKAYE